MWSRTYQFGDVFLRIESELEIKESQRFSVFRSETYHYDYLVKVEKGEIPEFEMKNDRSSKLRWNKDKKDYLVRYMQTLEGMMPYAYTCEDERTALQIYTERSLEYLDTRLVFEGFDFFWLLNRNRAVTLHASYIENGGKAVLFSGPSGMGKSTQADLWKKCRDANVINGDRALIQKQNDIFYAHGLCYAGTSGICKNVSLPLNAIVVLEQSEQNYIKKLRGGESLKALLPQCSYHKDNKSEMDVLTSVLAELLTEIPVYRLSCTPDERAVKVLEEVL